MRRIGRMAAAVCAMLFLFGGVTAAAAEPAGTLTVSLESLENGETARGQADVPVSLYQLAAPAGEEVSALRAQPAWEALLAAWDLTAGETLCTRERAAEAAAFAALQELTPCAQAVSDAAGQAVFAPLERGLYLVTVAGSGQETADPFLVTLPLWEDGAWVYDVTAAPKLSPRATQPDEPLSTTVPVASPGRSLPQTGQRKWPAWVLAAAGVTLLVAGYAVRCTPKRGRS